MGDGADGDQDQVDEVITASQLNNGLVARDSCGVEEAVLCMGLLGRAALNGTGALEQCSMTEI